MLMPRFSDGLTAVGESDIQATSSPFGNFCRAEVRPAASRLIDFAAVISSKLFGRSVFGSSE